MNTTCLGKPMLHLTLILCTVILFTTKGRSQDIPKIRIDPAQAYGGIVSDYFENVEFIPLETTKESLFGSIGALIITDSSIVVYDWDTRAILFFSLEGKFITKHIQKESTNSIVYNIEIKAIKLSPYNSKMKNPKTQYYSITGTPLGTDIEGISNNLAEKMIPLKGEYSVSMGNCRIPRDTKAKDSTYSLVNIYKGNSLHKAFLKYNQKNDIAYCALGTFIVAPKVITNGSFYVSTPLDHIVYKINTDTAIQQFQFVFPHDLTFKKSILESTDPHIIDSVRKEQNTYLTVIIRVGDIFFHKTNLFFKTNTVVYMHYPASESKNQHNFIYDTLTRKLVSLERLTVDAMCYYLPIFNSIGLRGLDYSNNKFYTDISSLDMFAAYEKNKFRNPQYPPVLQEYFKTQDRKSNPLIVRLKQKE